MKKRKHVRKLISLLLVMALMSTCLGVGSVSVAVSADDRYIPRKRGLCITGWHNTNPNDSNYQYQPWFYHNVDEMNHAFNNLFNRDAYSVYNEWSTAFVDNGSSPTWSSCAPVFAEIHAQFDDSNPDDINYLYLTGHGYYTPNEYPYLTNCMHIGGIMYYGGLHSDGHGGYLDTLKSVLDTIPGHFVIFIQSCDSGQAIGRSETNPQDDDTVDSASHEEQIINAFFEGTDEETIHRNGELAGTSKYTVFCSASTNEFSHVLNNNARLCSLITYIWAKGLGWQIDLDKLDDLETGVNGVSCDLFADKTFYVDNTGKPRPGNNDGIVTAEELNCYTSYFLLNPDQGITLPGNTLLETPVYYSMYPFRTIATLDYPLGNPYQDGCISNKDVLLIRKYLDGLIPLDQRQKELANVNGTYSLSGHPTITEGDVWLIQKYIAGIPLT